MPDDFDPLVNTLWLENAGHTELKIWKPQYRDVLDKGFIGLIDFMGDDQCVVDAARVSYGSGTRRVQEDRGLIRYLIRNRHWTPIEMVEIKWHVKAPIFVFRQWHRHRTASINEYSARYSILNDDMYMPPAEAMKPQSAMNKQGRDGALSDNNTLACHLQIENVYAQCAQAYKYLLGLTEVPDDSLNHRFDLIKMFAIDRIKDLQKTNPDWKPELVTDAMIDAKIKEIYVASGLAFTDAEFWGDDGSGLARELARIVMPLSTYSEMYWKCDLRNTFGFLSLRFDPHAQDEVRAYAGAMMEMMEPIAPLCMAAFMDYQMEGKSLSRMEVKVIKQMYGTLTRRGELSDQTIEAIMQEAGAGKREISEFIGMLSS